MKEKKKNNKFNLLFSLIVLLGVFIMLVACTYSYYVKEIKKDNKDVTINTITMSMQYFNQENIELSNLKPGFTYKYNFSVNNYSEDIIGKYKLIFDIETPLNNNIDEDFTYSLEATSDSNDKTKKVVRKIFDTLNYSKKLKISSILPDRDSDYAILLELEDGSKFEIIIIPTRRFV